MESYPEEINAYYHVGKIAEISGKQLEKAEAYLQKYLEADLKENSPSRDDAHYLLGAIYQKKGARADAIKQYEMALKLNPNHELARKELDVLK